MTTEVLSPGALVGWRSGDRRLLGLYLATDRDTGEWWILALQRPWRRVRRPTPHAGSDPTFLLLSADAVHTVLLAAAQTHRGGTP